MALTCWLFLSHHINLGHLGLVLIIKSSAACQVEGVEKAFLDHVANYNSLILPLQTVLGAAPGDPSGT